MLTKFSRFCFLILFLPLLFRTLFRHLLLRIHGHLSRQRLPFVHRVDILSSETLQGLPELPVSSQIPSNVRSASLGSNNRASFHGISDSPDGLFPLTDLRLELRVDRLLVFDPCLLLQQLLVEVADDRFRLADGSCSARLHFQFASNRSHQWESLEN